VRLDGSLAAVAHLVDGDFAEADGHLLVHVAEPDPAVDPSAAGTIDLGVRALDPGVHPFGEVAGLVAPPEWTAFGVRVRGRAHQLDRPGARPERTAVTFLVDRLGREVSLQRTGADTRTIDSRAEGTIPDLCRRVLGLGTPPAPSSTALLWTASWLDRLLAAWGRPEARRQLTSSWAALAAHHPAAGPGADLAPAALVRAASAHARARPWSVLRALDEPLELPGGPLQVEVARWMDDGFFARWAIGAFPSIPEVVADLAPLLGAELGATLRATTLALLEPP
jgi:hypothetical protein